MNDDELLRRLAETAREEERDERDRVDPRWDELAAGRLSAEDEAALRRRAEESMEEKQALEAFTPLGADFRARAVRAAREQIGPPAKPAEDAAAADPGPAVRPFRLPERERRWPVRWAAAAALAAALLVLVLWPDAERGPLPGYQAMLTGTVRTERGPGAEGAEGSAAPAWPETASFAPGNRFELVLRPESAIEGPLEVRTFRQTAGSLVPWPLPSEIAEGGAVRLAGTVGRDVELPPGESTLVAVVGRRGALPAADVLLARLGESGHAGDRGWWAWRWRLATAEAAEP